MKNIIIINGPNLNLLGKRETDIYGLTSFEEFFESLKAEFPQLKLSYYQSNIEGELIDKVHEWGFGPDKGIVMNAGGYTHTSVALADAVAAVTSPVIEVHISNIHAREEFRHKSLMAKNCVGVIAGLGLYGYKAGIEFLLSS